MKKFLIFNTQTIRIIKFKLFNYSVCELCKSSEILILPDYIKLLNCIFVKEILNETHNPMFNDSFKKDNETHSHATRQTTRNSIPLPQPSTKYYRKNSVKHQSACICNSMHPKLSINMIEESTSKMKSVLFNFFITTIYSTYLITTNLHTLSEYPSEMHPSVFPGW